MRFETASEHFRTVPVGGSGGRSPATAIACELFDQVDQFADGSATVAVVRWQFIELAVDQLRQATVDQDANIMGARVHLGLAERET